MPHSADLELRDRAIVALTLLTGVRDGALVSLKLKHLNITEGLLVQDAREVNTKFAKSFTTWFFPVGCNAMGIIEHWVSHLQKAKLWGVGDPLFPATAVINGEARKFEAAGLSRRHWSSAAPVRMIFRNAFASVELPYFNPHSFRKTLARLGERICRTPEQLKAWSQNLGHDDVLTTLKSYGSVASDRQAEIIRDLAIGSDADFNPRAALKGLEDFIRQKEGIIALDSNLWVHQRVAHGMICYAIGQLKIF